jgi:hypothetical protein
MKGNILSHFVNFALIVNFGKNHHLSSSAEIKNKWNCYVTVLHVFLVRYKLGLNSATENSGSGFLESSEPGFWNALDSARPIIIFSVVSLLQIERTFINSGAMQYQMLWCFVGLRRSRNQSLMLGVVDYVSCT